MKKRFDKIFRFFYKEVTARIMVMMTMTIMLLVIFLGRMIWTDYQDTLMKNQQDQLLAQSEALAANMEYSLGNYLDRLDYMAGVDREVDPKHAAKLFDAFVETKGNFVTGLVLKDGEGNEIVRSGAVPEQEEELITVVNDTVSIFEYNDNPAGIHSIGFRKIMESGRNMEIFIDGEQYYQSLVNAGGIGTNGYIMIKNSSGTVVMHVTDEQWGIDVIEGRRVLYPEADLSSVEAMIREQEQGDSGISIYYSYWWAKKPLQKVKKISAYAPIELGSDFWIVSAVVDYNDYYGPIATGFRFITALFVGAIIGISLMFILFGMMMYEHRNQAREIGELKLLNESLEKLQHGEQTLAHHERLQVMGTMTGGIAHEINNYLTPIMGYAELLMMTLPEDSEEQEYAKEVYDASDKCKDVIRQLSSMSRKNVETVLETTSAFTQVERSARMMDSICTSNIKLEKINELHDERILINATQINQVLLNICVNAVHAIGNKEGRIQIYACVVPRETLVENPELEKHKIPEDWKNYVRIDISDNGCGMDKATMDQMFNPFFTTKKAGEGTGLGLALAEQYITSHRGYIYAESALGEGTTFHIYLPVAEQAEAAKAVRDGAAGEVYGPDNDPCGLMTLAADAYEDISINKKLDVLEAGEDADRNRHPLLTIVVADDNQKVLNLLEKRFEKLNVDMITCGTREDLNTMLEKVHPDVLLIDDTIPDGRGIDFCMTIKERYADVIKILMTDVVTREVVEGVQKKIIDEYLQKPVSDASIIEAVRNVTKRRNG